MILKTITTLKFSRTLSPIKSLTLLLLALLAISCERRPLEEPWETGNYADILLVTDWSELEEVPTGLTAVFYPDDGGRPISLVTNSIKQNVIRLPRGRYHMLVFNQSVYEFGSMSFSGMDQFGTACASLQQLTTNSSVTAADYRWLATMLTQRDSLDMAMRTPEPFNADRLVYEVTEEMCKRQYYKETGIAQNIPIWDLPEPEEYVDTIFSTPPPVPPTLHVKVNVKGINNAYQVRAYITNMARSDLFGPHVNTNAPAIHVMSDWKITPAPSDVKVGEITSSIRCFGVPNMKVTETDIYKDFGTRADTRSATRVADYGENFLVLDFLLKDGKTHSKFLFEVSDNITYDEDELRLDVELKIDGSGGAYPVVLPDVPDVIGSGGAGFDATVEDWKHEDHNIKF